MNLQKVGKFIAKMRKKVGLTQSDLGEALGVTGKAVSKWERGLNAPDITVLVELSKLLKVTPKEILMGEEIENNLSTEDDNEITISSINTYNNYSKKKYMKIIIILVSIIVLIITVFSTTYFITNYNKCFVYKLSSADKKYHLDGLLANNLRENSIIITNIRCDDNYEKIDENVSRYSVELMINNLQIDKQDFIYDHSEKYFSDIIKNTNVIFSKNYLISWDNNMPIKNNDIKIIIKFYNNHAINNIIEIPIKVEKKFSNDKLFY